uniref:Uncharacterized protein n=1 Tax=viral metagenome TaxID=1070528 RepID=A0A6C0CC07_9ZZZZ
MENIIYDDVLNELKLSMIPIDLYNLSRTCNRYNKSIPIKYIKERIMNEIDRRLRIIFGEDFEEFAAIFRNSKAVITGSFITQCILGEYWDNNIDIIVDKDELNEPFSFNLHLKDEFLIASFRNDKKIIRYAFFKYEYDLISTMPYECLYVTNIMFKVNETCITFEIADQQKHNICKNTYGLDKTMFIYTMNEISSRCTNFYPDLDLHAKYRKRGFRFYDDNKKVVANCDIWKKMNINFVKITPCDNKSTEERLQILTTNARDYVHIEHVIANEYGEDLYTVHNDLKNHRFVSCFHKFITNSCLFKDMYPGVEHLHSYVDDNQTLLVVDISNFTSTK